MLFILMLQATILYYWQNKNLGLKVPDAESIQYISGQCKLHQALCLYLYITFNPPKP